MHLAGLFGEKIRVSRRAHGVYVHPNAATQVTSSAAAAPQVSAAAALKASFGHKYKNKHLLIIY